MENGLFCAFVTLFVENLYFLCYNVKKRRRGNTVSKDTTKIVEELKLSPDFKSFYEENTDSMITKSLSELLNELIKEKNIKKNAAIDRAELSEIYGYQIFSGARLPERKKLICLAIGMELDLEQTQRVLRCGGYSPLYVKLPFDAVVMYAIVNRLSVIQANEMLYEYMGEML